MCRKTTTHSSRNLRNIETFGCNCMQTRTHIRFVVIGLIRFRVEGFKLVLSSSRHLEFIGVKIASQVQELQTFRVQSLWVPGFEFCV